MIIRYSGHFTVMNFVHVVQFYAHYSKEIGLRDEKEGEGVSSRRIDTMLKAIGPKITKEQRKAIKFAMQNRDQCAIIDEKGNVYSK